MRDTPTYCFISLLLFFNLTAFLIFYFIDFQHTIPAILASGVLAFFLTYLLDITLHFYYLKRRHLDNFKPRVLFTLVRVTVLIGLFRVAFLNR